MKQIVTVIVLAALLASCSQPQKKLHILTGDIGTDIVNLLPAGEHIADVMDGVKGHPRLAQLTAKFQEGIKNNYEWYIEYMKTIPEGEPMPFHSNLGITKAEYEEMVEYLNSVEIASSGKEKIRIELNKDTIYFKANGKLSYYNSLKIDIRNNLVFFDEYKMLFSDTSNITDDKNGLRSRWKGYTWKFEEPMGITLDDLKDLENLKMKEYSITIGRLEKNGKTFIQLKGREVEDGVKNVEFELPVIF